MIIFQAIEVKMLVAAYTSKNLRAFLQALGVRQRRILRMLPETSASL